MNNKTISTELRKRVTEKFQALLPTLQLNNTAEAIENTCFEKSENNSDNYMKICQNFISNRTKQIESSQNRNAVIQNFRPNMASTSNNGTASDPINALQNLTVTAGQPGQINIQQTHPQPQMSIRMTNQMFPNQIRNRPMAMPVTMQSGNMQFPMSQSPTTQIMQPQIMQQGHGINSINTANSNNIRLVTKNPINQQNQQMTPTYQIENGAQMAGQQMPGMVQQTVGRPQMTRIMTNSPNPVNQGPVQQNQQVQLEQPSIPKQNPVTPNNNNVQPTEESQSQTTSNSQMNSSNNNNTSASGNNTNPPSTTNSAPAKAVISEEESIKVKEELSKLSERYLKYLQLVIQNPVYINVEQMKVWKTLSAVLEDPNALHKNISLKHVTRIQDFCEKAEHVAQQHNLDKSKHAAVVPKTEEIFGKRIIPDRNRPTAALTDISTVNLELTGLSNNVNNSLDVAFDDVIHQLKKKDGKLMRTIQRNLVKFVRKNRANCLHYLPRNLQSQEDDVSDTDGHKIDTNYDEHEFDYIDSLVHDNGALSPPHNHCRVLDQHGLLRTDFDASWPNPADFRGLQAELDLIKSEFQVQPIGEQPRTARWTAKDDVWEPSATFLSVSCRSENLPATVPPLLLRVPADYEVSGAVDWSLNLELYRSSSGPIDNQDGSAFLEEVRAAVEAEFADLVASSHWAGVGLLRALSVYKRSIQTGFSNYQCRKALS